VIFPQIAIGDGIWLAVRHPDATAHRQPRCDQSTADGTTHKAICTSNKNRTRRHSEAHIF